MLLIVFGLLAAPLRRAIFGGSVRSRVRREVAGSPVGVRSLTLRASISARVSASR